MKVGIITFSNAVNYGAVLQSYALKEKIEAISNCEVDIIDYRFDPYIAGRTNYRKMDSFRHLIYNMVIFLNIKFRKNHRTLLTLFDKFKEEKLGINNDDCVTRETVTNHVGKYNVLIAGSDQIWNLKLTDDPVYFLPFKKSYPSIRYCSYAASIANHITKENEEKYRKYLADFDFISVRERVTAEELRLLLKRKVECCVDPVLLLSGDEWKQKIREDTVDGIEDGYIFAFFISRDSHNQDFLNSVRDKHNKRIVILDLTPLGEYKADQYFYYLAPLGFVDIISRADVIVSDSFHATAFSILFKKDFYTIKRSDRNIRIENLLSFVNGSSRLVDNPEDIRKEHGELDYNQLDEKIIESTKYLETIIGEAEI